MAKTNTKTRTKRAEEEEDASYDRIIAWTNFLAYSNNDKADEECMSDEMYFTHSF